jgi:hypothetical protein
MSHTPLIDARVWQLLLTIDRELATNARATGCACGGPLHSARYPRKPRGGLPAEFRPAYSQRESLCCARADCRRRTTPPSVCFLGRRVFLAAVVVLVSAMTAGLTAKRAAHLRLQFGVRERTLQRWRAWWLQTFPRTVFWKGARARLMPPADEQRLPASLLERFPDPLADALVACLKFLAPVTTREGYAMAA